MMIESELNLDKRPVGQISRIYLSLIEDGMHQPVPMPVLIARGMRPGPVIALTAAVHGDELNGISVIHRLFERLDCRALRGTIVAVPVVNVPAFRRRTRRFPDGVDLNHIMPGDADGPTAMVYAQRFVEKVVRHTDRLVDLHTASRGRINSLYIRADMSDPVAARMARLHKPQIVLDDPPSDKTLRGMAAELGIPAITVEVGDPQRFQPAYARRTLAGLRAVLADFKMLPSRRKTAVLADPLICRSSRWLRTDAGGLLEVYPKVATLLKAGEPMARLTDIFGHPIREYTAPCDGVVIGKSVDPVAETGARIVHLGLVDGGDGGAPTPIQQKETWQ
jgi:hypothetical protein